MKTKTKKLTLDKFVGKKLPTYQLHKIMGGTEGTGALPAPGTAERTS